MDVLTYYDIQREFLYLNEEHDKLESCIDYDELMIRGVREDEFPNNFRDCKKLGIYVEQIVCHCSDDDVVDYFFDQIGMSINVIADNFTNKEALTVINLVMKHMELDKKWCHQVTFGYDGEANNFTRYAQDPTAFGSWWNDFLDLFDKRKQDIESIEINFYEHHQIEIVLCKKKQ